jgi:Tol biopolymer transport system component
MTTKPIGRVREGAPLAISRAGDRVAYVDGEQSNAVKVVELDRPDRISTFSINGSLNRMSFSPEGNQILFDTYQEGKRMGVIDLSKGRVITIPRPKGQAIPPGVVLADRSSIPNDEFAIAFSRPRHA